MRFCPACGAPAAAGSTICPVCKSDLLPNESAEQGLTPEEVGVPQALLAPGASLEWWERAMANAGRRRQARVALTALAVALLLLVNVLAWQNFVHGSWGARLSTYHQILFAGSNNDPLTGCCDSGARAAPPQLYTIHQDGTGLRRLTNPATGGYFSPAWSPDGTHLAAFRIAPHERTATLVIMRADGTNLQAVPSVVLSLDSFQLGNGVVDGPLTKLIAWSPDSSQLIAPTGQDSYVLLDADGTRPRPIDGDRPAWAPDGRHIAYYGLNRGGPIFNADFFPVQLTGSPLVILDTRTFQSQELTTIPDLSVGALAWSPDGRYLAATTWRMDAQQNQPVGGVVIVRPDGSNVHGVIQWAGGEADQLTWSPDGHQLAAMVEQSLPLDQYGGIDFSGPADPHLWVVNSDSSNPRDLGTCDTDQPTWAPDGQHLLVVRYLSINSDSGQSQMLLVDANRQGATSQALTPADQQIFREMPRYVFAPSWSPV